MRLIFKQIAADLGAYWKLLGRKGNEQKSFYKSVDSPWPRQ
jgi:hypothetical protein